MENETDLIREQMEGTRTSLTEKLEALEEKVVSTVQETTASVAETVQNVSQTVHETVSDVSESVQETVETVKNTFDLTQQTERHPWGMFGGAVAVGFLAGRLLPSAERIASRAAATAEAAVGGTPYSSSSAPYSHPYSPTSQGAPTGASSSWFAGLSEQLGPVADKLKGMAIGALTSLAGEMVLRSTPEQFRSQLSDWIEELTRSLGGTPIQGLKEYLDDSTRHQHQGHPPGQAPQQQSQPHPQHTGVS